ncbi:MAG: orotidine-5'-phosphate decarboxylase [Planctomycetota bacterium]|jgi:orotidine-5'-phosphate decarboxylase
MARQALDNAGADHAADRLVAAVDRAGSPVCVGIDPVLERLPAQLRPGSPGVSQAVEALAAFAIGVLDAIAGHVGCVKLQAACFERYRHRGVEALERVIGEARQRGFLVILDAKRGDVSVSAEHYAAGAFDPAPGADRPDWITVNSYLGDAQRLADGRTVAEAVATMVAQLGKRCVGRSGFSAVGAVVGATRPAEVAGLRALMPQQIFLVPGYGAQGGGVADIRPCFLDRGRGAIVAASRSVIYAFDPGADDWKGAVRDAARRFADEVGRASR